MDAIQNPIYSSSKGHLQYISIVKELLLLFRWYASGHTQAYCTYRSDTLWKTKGTKEKSTCVNVLFLKHGYWTWLRIDVKESTFRSTQNKPCCSASYLYSVWWFQALKPWRNRARSQQQIWFLLSQAAPTCLFVSLRFAAFQRLPASPGLFCKAIESCMKAYLWQWSISCLTRWCCPYGSYMCCRIKIWTRCASLPFTVLCWIFCRPVLRTGRFPKIWTNQRWSDQTDSI